MENFTDFVISAEIITYEGVNILQFGSGFDGDRILIFGSTEGMHTLRRVKPSFMDGAFRASPSITPQLFPKHELFKDKVLPILFGQLTDKTQETYAIFLEEV